MALDIKTEFSQLLEDIEDEMGKVLSERDDGTRPLYDMLAYHLGIGEHRGAGGKRLRSLIGLLAYQSLTGEYRKALPGVAAVELGHNFSLVHDDIEDQDRERRHRPTVWAVWGVPMAINAGDTLFALSRLALHRPVPEGEEDVPDRKKLDMMKMYDETCLALCEGQYLDISFEQRDDVRVEEYLDMIGKKTAALIAASVHAAAILATDDPQIHEAYRRFGYDLGIAFQIADDLKGAFGSSSQTGKREAGDIAKRKKTLPVIWALQNVDGDPGRRLREIYRPIIRALDGRAAPGAEQLLDEATVSEVLRILESCGARDYAVAEARRYRDQAIGDLVELPILADGQQILVRLVQAIIDA
ncbi:MAG: polyprenyl synthetase family protein [Candidatus Limnocylindria bacterium]